MIDAMVRKLDEEEGNFQTYWQPFFMALRSILLAGNEEQPKEHEHDWFYHPNLQMSSCQKCGIQMQGVPISAGSVIKEQPKEIKNYDEVIMSLSNRLVDVESCLRRWQDKGDSILFDDNGKPRIKELKIGGYQTLALRIEDSNRRIGMIESKLEPKNMKAPIKERFESIERRIASVEQHQIDKADQTMRKFDDVLKYVGEIEKRVESNTVNSANMEMDLFQLKKRVADCEEMCKHPLYITDGRPVAVKPSPAVYGHQFLDSCCPICQVWFNQKVGHQCKGVSSSSVEQGKPSKNEPKPAIVINQEQLAKCMRVYSGWDWGEDDCIRISEAVAKDPMRYASIVMEAKNEP